jgi:GT2 family glycosyltransferase
MNERQPTVDLIVLNYRMREDLRRCLLSLRDLSYRQCRVIVVDNGSRDGTEEMVREEFPEATFIQTGVNSGYTGGNNRGLEAAIARGADYAMILNPDTILANHDFIGEMVAVLEAERGIGIAGPRVFLREAGTVQNTVLFPPGLWRSLINWFRFRLAPGTLVYSGNQMVEAEVLNGVCLLLRIACLREIGLFDEHIFMYIEDAEMQHRARQAGWRVTYLPIDSVIHRQKREGYDHLGRVGFLLKRNSLYYLDKIGRRKDAFGYAVFSVLLTLLRGIASLDREQFRSSTGFSKSLLDEYWQIRRKRVPLPLAWLTNPDDEKCEELNK